MQFGNFFASYTSDSSWSQVEGAGLSLRLGRHLFVLGHFAYRDRNCPWPKRLRFSLSIARPAA
jgi:hypothetical protein